MYEMEKLEWKDTFKPSPVRVVITIHAQKLVKNGLGHFLLIQKDKFIVSPIESVLVVHEFLKVF